MVSSVFLQIVPRSLTVQAESKPTRARRYRPSVALPGPLCGGLVDRLKERPELADAAKPVPTRRRQRVVGQVLVIPGHVVRDVDGPSAQLNYGRDVRAQRVADHHELCRLDATPVSYT